MDKEEILKYLKENLKIQLDYDIDKDLEVVLVLEDEIISKDWVSLPPEL